MRQQIVYREMMDVDHLLDVMGRQIREVLPRECLEELSASFLQLAQV